MSGCVGLACLGAFEAKGTVLCEIDHALALIGTTHWIERCRLTAFHSRRRPTSVPPAANTQIGLRRLGVTGLFAAVAARFCVYVVLLVRAVTGVRTPARRARRPSGPLRRGAPLASLKLP